ncbi:MAG: Sec-independent protein translocase protein TatB [Betaproteobacteria bacterium]
MFDFGISEIMVIAVVALVVIGPERLPRVARTIGTLLGRAQRYVNDVKAEVTREMELDELRKLQSQMQDAARDIQQTVSTAGADVKSAVHDAEKSLNEAIAPVTDSAATAAVSLTEITALAEPPGTPLSAPDATASATAGEVSPSLAPSSAGEVLPSAAVIAETGAVTVETPLTPHPDMAAEGAPTQTSLFPENTIR